jgi:hypothetical protein
MSKFATLVAPKLPSVSIEITPPNRMTMRGTITTLGPSQDLSAFFRAVHRAALADRAREVRVDVCGLDFANSSAIRMFVDWATLVRNETAPCYKLRFVTNRRITWQQTSFTALRHMIGDAIAVEPFD